MRGVHLADFLRSKGAFVHNGLDMFAHRASGIRGVFAAEPIAKGVLLLRLPRDAVLAACEDDCEWMPEDARHFSPIIRTALSLLRERALGPCSSWYAYLATLPIEYDTVEHWALEELAALCGTSVYDELDGLRDTKTGEVVGAARVLWKSSIAPLVLAAPQVWPGASLDQFLHAFSTVQTRGFYDTAPGGGGPYMLPAIDMLNHACQGNATSLVVERDESGQGSESLVFAMEAERDIAAGEELTHMYDHFE